MSELNLYQKIADVKANIDGFTKDTKGYNYTYVSGSQVLHRIRNKMIEHNLLLVPKTLEETYSVEDVTRYSPKYKKQVTTTEYTVKVKLIYTWINADKPEEQLELPFFAIGQQDDPAKALGTALTYSERYFLMKFFNIPTDEDDADAKQKKEQYTKPDAKAIGTLKEEMLKFSELMQSLGKQVTIDDVQNQLGISDIQALTNAQISALIKKLDNWTKQAKENE
ncbi:TPA: ERF family protein [Staphylococcus pseudintermedius]|uniref:ERF family protein n=1 Tax=Staphylococcus pseudintermedius TaxID=283734 RepID=UPI0018E0F74F|nr:ERF family protein [Staphylococcus pseudintermedius]EGQ1310196.1 single-stranded DNA-binding protein [Staphylococcus pseudintermedius]EGQ1725630.1 single-stranded DNA-binding protein [Staphylococcus pseudintermedius]EGQ2787388.1 single-stranded DNA-binding protein [Staphylococcus pseudintermedius]EGQ3337773.1 single-stranded DNA-binding protein [Staphylococcus pseudintermedius]EGQ3402861.1 single-stranded DNA-binding protein [Staphylococcus pseudintermedius]